jgi:hypothetical protein
MVSRNKVSEANYGIQADTVRAEVQAVGPKARAQKIILSSALEETLGGTNELRKLIAGNRLSGEQRGLLEKQLQAIEQEAARAKPSKKKVQSSLSQFKSSLDSISHLVGDVSGFLRPIAQIANAFGIVLPSP